MKQAKKLVSLLLALVMMLGLMTTTFAADPETETEPTPDPASIMQGNLEGGKIVITNAVPGQTYRVYQLLYLESYKVSNTEATSVDGTDRRGTYAYRPNSYWDAFLKLTRTDAADTEPYPADFITIDSDGYAIWNGGVLNSRVETLSKLAVAYCNEEGNKIEPVLTVKANDDGTVVFEGLKLGYYLVDSTVGTLCELYTTNPNIEINEKNLTATNIKTVQENGNYSKTSDSSIGQEIKFESTLNVQKGAANYVFHDKMAQSMTYKQVDLIQAVLSEARTDLVAYSENIDDEAHTVYDYKVIKNPEDDCTFHVEFNQTFLDSNQVQEGTSVDIYYTAVLNENAVVGGTRIVENSKKQTDYSILDGCTGGNENISWLEYGEDKTNRIKTQESKTLTYTWPVTIHKIAYTTSLGGMMTDAAKAEQVISLAGAEFRLTSDAVGHNEIKFTQYGKTNADGSVIYQKNDKDQFILVDVKDETGNVIYEKNEDGTEKVDENGEKIPVKEKVQEIAYLCDPNGSSTITTNLNGYITLEGLDSGTYYLWETKAPNGYKILSEATTITITNAGAIKQNNSAVTHIDVRNNSGNMMPTTGGIGTTIFYVAGAILVLGAAVLLITKRRMKSER